MAQAKVYPPKFSAFSPPVVISGGWRETFPIYFHGADVPNGFAVDAIVVDFADSDNAAAMDNKMRDAAQAKATARGLTVAQNAVVSFAPPRRL